MSTVQTDAVLTIAYRDFLKFLRDRVRILSSLVFPLILVAVLGSSLQDNLGPDLGYNFLVFTFTGVWVPGSRRRPPPAPPPAASPPPSAGQRRAGPPSG